MFNCLLEEMISLCFVSFLSKLTKANVKIRRLSRFRLCVAYSIMILPLNEEILYKHFSFIRNTMRINKNSIETEMFARTHTFDKMMESTKTEKTWSVAERFDETNNTDYTVALLIVWELLNTEWNEKKTKKRF